LTRELQQLRLNLQKNPEGLSAEEVREWRKQQALAYVNKELSIRLRQRSECAKREMMEEAALQAAEVLPSAETLEKIQRYETKLERQMFRAMAQLERLQRMRRGETVPAPVSVAVS
jgi:8-oxo-dGTP pyrophosphatase MutT (NUDIX family)